MLFEQRLSATAWGRSSDDRHFADEDVEKAVRRHWFGADLADAGDARIAFFLLAKSVAVLRGGHGAELEDTDGLVS